MSPARPIRAALLSVYHKDRLAPLVATLRRLGVTLYSTGGTQKFLEEQGAEVTAVEDLTGFPEVFGGRVKTLHPKVFGGILHRRHEAGDLAQAEQHGIPPIDLVVVDLYPFEETVASGAAEQDVIEKIDIGGIALLRAAAKNYRDVLVVSSREQYEAVTELLERTSGSPTLEDRRHYAAAAFATTSHYDTEIFKYVSQGLGLENTQAPGTEPQAQTTPSALRRKPPPERRVHRRPGGAVRPVARQAAELQQPGGRGRGRAAYARVCGRPAHRGHPQAHQCLRRGPGRQLARGVPARPGLRPGIGLRRRHYREPGGGRGHGPGAEQAVF